MYEIRRQVAMGEWVASRAAARFAPLRLGVAGASCPGRQARRTSPRSDSHPSAAGFPPACRWLAPAGIGFRPFGRGRISTCTKAPADWPPATPDSGCTKKWRHRTPRPKRKTGALVGAPVSGWLGWVSRGSSGWACRPRHPRPGSRSIGPPGCRCPSPPPRDRS